MFSDDLQELHLFMTMLELIPRGTETIASITEQFGLKQGLPYRESPLQKCDGILLWQGFSLFFSVTFENYTRKILPSEGETDGGLLWLKYIFFISWAFWDINTMIRKSHHKLSWQVCCCLLPPPQLTAGQLASCLEGGQSSWQMWLSPAGTLDVESFL